MAVTPAVFFKFGRPALEKFLAARAERQKKLASESPEGTSFDTGTVAQH